MEDALHFLFRFFSKAILKKSNITYLIVSLLYLLFISLIHSVKAIFFNKYFRRNYVIWKEIVNSIFICAVSANYKCYFILKQSGIWPCWSCEKIAQTQKVQKIFVDIISPTFSCEHSRWINVSKNVL